MKALAIKKADELVKIFGSNYLALKCAEECSKIALPEHIKKNVNSDFIELSVEFWYYVINELENKLNL